jgi:hypothetical protein
MSNDIKDLKDKIIQGFETIQFEQSKENRLIRVINETPEEISRMATHFKSNEIDKIVTTESDFLLGTLISFIYYKFLLYSTLEGNAILQSEIPKFLESLFSNSSNLLELINKIIGK